MIACPKCGNESADTAHFCGFCGAKLQGAAPSQTIFGMQAAISKPAPAPAPAPPPPAPAPPPPAPAPPPPAFAPAPPPPAAAPSPPPASAPTAPLDGPDTLPLEALPPQQPAPAAAPVVAPAPAVARPLAAERSLPSPKAAPKSDKGDEEAFFGASLSQYDIKGISRDELVMDDIAARSKGRSILPVVVAALLLGAVAGAVVYFAFLS